MVTKAEEEVHTDLTRKMRWVMRELAKGKNMAQIAREAGLARNTVKSHMQRAAWRLGIPGRVGDVARWELRAQLNTLSEGLLLVQKHLSRGHVAEAIELVEDLIVLTEDTL